MGYIIFLILLLLKNFKKMNAIKMCVGIFLVFLIGTMVYVLLQEKSETLSYVDRTEDSLKMIVLFLQKPIIGYGFNQGSYSFNGFLTILVSFGFFSALFYYQFYLSGLSIMKIANARVSAIAFWIFLLLVLSNEPIGLSNFTILIMTLGLSNSAKKVREKNKYARLYSIK